MTKLPVWEAQLEELREDALRAGIDPTLGPPTDEELQAFGVRYTAVMEEYRILLLRCVHSRRHFELLRGVSPRDFLSG